MPTSTDLAIDFQDLVRRTEETELPVYARMPISFVSGQGCWLTDSKGEKYLDLYGGHAVASTGHCHPKLVAAIQEQAARLMFYSSSIYCPQRALANELLLKHAPHKGSRVFHCSAGTEANETAMKIARLATGRSEIISFSNSFHGRTFGSLSACGIYKYRQTAGVMLDPETRQIAFGDSEALQSISEDTAAVLCETIQSLGGVIGHEDAYYKALEARCREVGALLICDEIQTGLGRCGRFFFSDLVGIKPDLITMAKGIASGLAAAAVIVAPELAAKSKSGDQGNTFGGGPLAMAAMAATLQVIEDEKLVENAAARGQQIREGLKPLRGVRRLLGRGLLIGVDMDKSSNEVQAALRQHHIIAGGSSNPNVLRLLPPLTISEEEVNLFLKAMQEILGN